MAEARKWMRMRESLSGGRYDGRPWPPAGEKIDVPDWEYERSLAAGWAVHADPDPEPAPPEPVKAPEPEPVRVYASAHKPEPEEKYKPEPEPARVQARAPEPVRVPAEVSRETAPEEDAPRWQDEFGGSDPPGAPAPEPEPAEPPRPSDPKQDWIDYAADQGLDREKAAAMSKADLMSRYGGRL
jgi:hypothetical protein